MLKRRRMLLWPSCAALLISASLVGACKKGMDGSYSGSWSGNRFGRASDVGAPGGMMMTMVYGSGSLAIGGDDQKATIAFTSTLSNSDTRVPPVELKCSLEANRGTDGFDVAAQDCTATSGSSTVSLPMTGKLKQEQGKDGAAAVDLDLETQLPKADAPDKPPPPFALKLHIHATRVQSP